MYNFFSKTNLKQMKQQNVFNRLTEGQYLLCCPLLDPQMAGTGELPPETMNWKQNNHFL